MAKDERLFGFEDKVVVTQVGTVMDRSLTKLGIEYRVRFQNLRGKEYDLFLTQRYLSELPEEHKDEEPLFITNDVVNTKEGQLLLYKIINDVADKLMLEHYYTASFNNRTVRILGDRDELIITEKKTDAVYIITVKSKRGGTNVEYTYVTEEISGMDNRIGQLYTDLSEKVALIAIERLNHLYGL